MKNKGDGFLPDTFKRDVCPFCGKKGYYKDYIECVGMKQWRCMYCKERGDKPKEKKDDRNV